MSEAVQEENNKTDAVTAEKHKKKQKAPETIRTDRVDVLDGIRAAAIFIVAFFHYWQQSWYSFTYESNFLKKIGIERINFDWLHRYGYLFVDMMILLTGFCLFLPYARHMIEGSKRPGLPDPNELWKFYKKRLVRIVPSYLFCFFIYLFIFILPDKFATVYGGWGDFFRDEMLWKNIIHQLTFSQNLSHDTYLLTPFNGALWTVAVEMQFYLIFPLLAWAFRKKPLITYGCMNAFSYAFIRFYVLKQSDDMLPELINQLPCFMAVFANGMLGALVFVALADRLKTRDRYTSVLFTGISSAVMFVIFSLMKKGYDSRAISSLQRWQIGIRFPMSVLFAIFAVSTCFAVKWYRFIFSNRLAVFLAGISYNFYIWHQPVAVKLKEHHLPAWEGTTPPNMLPNNETWQIKYTLLIVSVGIMVAIAVTYGLEKPLAKLFLKEKKKVEKN